MLEGKSKSPILNSNTKKDDEPKEIIPENADVSEEILKNKWEEIIDFLEKEHSMLYFHLKKVKYSLNETVISIFPSSTSIKNTLANQEKELTLNARKILNNKNISFKIDYQFSSKKAEEKGLFLVKDKYKYLINKNKQLEKLQEVFNLNL